MLAKKAHEAAERSPGCRLTFGRGNRATATRQMTADEPFDCVFVDLADRDASPTQPSRKVLGDLHAGLHGRNGMAAGLQIEGEAL